MQIKYLKKENLYPAFGRADLKNQIAYVRNDLPKSVESFVLQHELYHLQDNAKWWIWRETKANLYGAWKHPIGFIICCFMSLSWSRLRFYLKRFKRGS
jgi:hypothetical protein